MRRKSSFRAVGLLLAVAAMVRMAFLLRMELPVFDPWRHLKLLQNLRAGRGFTLFDSQPYLWYVPLWYRLCAALPRWVQPQWVAAWLSVISVALAYLWARRLHDPNDRSALHVGCMMAAFGPQVAFTCHYGAESFALTCMLAALWVTAAAPDVSAAVAGGALFGTAVCARLSLAFNVFLFFPVLRKGGSWVAFVGGAAAPLGLTWLRNHRVIASHPYVFLWDGLATPASGFHWLSTLVLPLHADVQEGLRTLHQGISPAPEWLQKWDLAAFMVLGVVCLFLSRRLSLILAGVSTLTYFLILDRSRSSNFFRLYLGLFPVLFAAIALTAERGRRLRWGPALPWALTLLVVACGVRFLEPLRMYPLEMVTPPPELLTEDAYMVTSGFYNPESLLYRFPDKRFIGMPLRPEEFEDFHRRFPQYELVLRRDFYNVQGDLDRYLVEGGGYEVVREATNPYGVRYAVLAPRSRSGLDPRRHP